MAAGISFFHIMYKAAMIYSHQSIYPESQFPNLATNYSSLIKTKDKVRASHDLSPLSHALSLVIRNSTPYQTTDGPEQQLLI